MPRDRGLCDACLQRYRQAHDRERIGRRERSHYDTTWRKRSKREIAEHIATHGYTCPTCDTAHPDTNRLTLDHVKPRSLDEGTAVLCARCNARKSNRVEPPQ